jgi:hypothetical protein
MLVIGGCTKTDNPNNTEKPAIDRTTESTNIETIPSFLTE